MVVILFQGTLNFSEMEVWRVGIDTLRKMHEKKTVVREESTQNDALLAIFFSCLVHETLTWFCILALKKNYTDNKQKLHRYTDG